MPPLMQLEGVGLGFGGNELIRDASFALHPAERIALIGRNGSGKSTLMQIISGAVEPDAGERRLQPRISVAYLPQAPDFGSAPALRDYVLAGVPEAEAWRGEMALEGLKTDGAIRVSAASGGERRRAALARLLAGDADLLLLDEPTNHLDIQAITWLENWLGSLKKTLLITSHDRSFLRAVTRQTLWIDRGSVRRLDFGFERFEAWRDAFYEQEDKDQHKLRQRIRAETRWSVEGISARRTRNQGRLRRLESLRAARRDHIQRAGRIGSEFQRGEASGRLVAEAVEVSKSFGSKILLRDF